MAYILDEIFLTRDARSNKQPKMMEHQFSLTVIKMIRDCTAHSVYLLKPFDFVQKKCESNQTL